MVRCTECNKILDSKTETVAKLSHSAGDIVKENVVPATCQQEGSYDNVVRCTECNEVLDSKTETVAKLSHNVDYRGICSNGNENYCTESAIGTLNAEKECDKMYYCHFNLKSDKYQIKSAGGNPVTNKKLYKADGTEVTFTMGADLDLEAGDYYFVFSTGFTGVNGGAALSLTLVHAYDYKGICLFDGCGNSIYKGECDKIYKYNTEKMNDAYVDPGVYKYTLAAGTYKTAWGADGTGFVGDVYNEEGTKLASKKEPFTVEEGTVVYVTYVAASTACRYLMKVTD